MIWHIFRKDVKLLWWLVVGVALLHLGARVTLYKGGHFGGNPSLMTILDLLAFGAYIGSAFLIAAVVHQDPVPGVRQDWLVRPVKRSDLLAAKLLFVLLLVQGPMLAVDWLGAMMFGFGPGESLAAALSRGLFLLCGLFLPLLVFASLTANLMEAVAGGMAAFLAVGGVMTLAMVQNGPGHPALPVVWSGVRWVSESARAIIVLAGAVMLLRTQYFQRKIALGRYIFAAGCMLWALAFFVPWTPAFAVQQRMSPSPGTGAPVNVAFDAARGRQPSEAPDSDGFGNRARAQGVQVYLPFRIEGLPDDSVLVANHTDVQVIAPDGTKQTVTGGDVQAHRDGRASGSVPIRQAIQMPPDLYDRLKNTSVRLEMDYSLTLLKLSEANAIPALDGDQRMPGIGWCKTRLNDAQTSVRVRCMVPGRPAFCITGFLENPATGLRNPPQSGCRPDYAPYVGQVVYDAMGRMGTNLPFRDPSGLAKYPVTGAQLKQARAVLRIYREQDHFTRRLAIDNVRFGDWEAR